MMTMQWALPNGFKKWPPLNQNLAYRVLGDSLNRQALWAGQEEVSGNLLSLVVTLTKRFHSWPHYMWNLHENLLIQQQQRNTLLLMHSNDEVESKSLISVPNYLYFLFLFFSFFFFFHYWRRRIQLLQNGWMIYNKPRKVHFLWMGASFWKDYFLVDKLILWEYVLHVARWQAVSFKLLFQYCILLS